MSPRAKWLTVAIGLAALVLSAQSPAPARIPPPTLDDTAAPGAIQTAVFSGGCFWGIQAVFEHVHGVISATSGYSGGTAATAHYETVGTETTGHAETVEVRFDPSKVTYGTLLQIFFSVAHDPTELNYQGPDRGTSYRSAVWTTSDRQAEIVKAYIQQLTDAHAYKGRIVTEVQPLKAFYEAEGYHQDYAVNNRTDPYIFLNDAPKVANLKKFFPDDYVKYKDW